MGDAEAGFVADLAAVEGLDGDVAVAVADMLVAIAGPLARLLVGLEQLAETEDLLIEIEDRFGVERIEREMRDARNVFLRAGQSEFLLRQRDRVALRIENAHLAVLQVAALGDHRAARIAFAVARDDLVDVVDGDAEMMQPVLHARLVQVGPVLEQRDVEAAVGQRHVARGAAADLVETEIPHVEAGERGRLRAQQSEISDARHRRRLT